jgi:four helix bundle protein
MDVVEAVYRVSSASPKSETYGRMGQLRRAAVSS